MYICIYVCVCVGGVGERTGEDRTGEDRTGQDRRGQDRRGMSECVCRGGRGGYAPLYVCSMAAQLKICS